MSRLTLDLHTGETVSINGGEIRVTLQKKSGQVARLVIEANEQTDIAIPRQKRGEGAASQQRMSAAQPK